MEFAETDAQALEKEMIELLQRRARIDPTSFPRVLAKWRKHRPTIRAYLDKGLVSVTPQLVADLRGALKLLLEEGSPRLQRFARSLAPRLSDLAFAAGFMGEPRHEPIGKSEPSVQTPWSLAFAKRPLVFEKNVGQAGAGIDYVARGAGFAVFLGDGEAAIVRTSGSKGSGTPVRMRLEGVKESTSPEESGPLGGRTHYLIGSDPSTWQTNIRLWERVRYRQVYPDIDLVYYGHDGRLEFDFVLQPHADPAQIRLSFPSRNPRLGQDGELLLADSSNALHLRPPTIYQPGPGGGRREVAGNYRLNPDGSVGFTVGDYDADQQLIIDPILDWASYLGGLGDDTPTAIAMDSAGDIYVAGTTTSANFPTSGGLQQAINAGGFVVSDVFVAKFDGDSRELVYSSYLGGRGDDAGLSVAVDAEGAVLIAGTTSSSDFPLLQPHQSVYANADDLIGSDAFLTKLDATGSSLVYSTYLGGSGLDTGQAVTVDSAGNAILAGVTSSLDLAVVNAFQPAHGGGAPPTPLDALLAKFDPNGEAMFVSYFGGSADDAGSGVAVGPANEILLVGVTESSDLPLVAPLQGTNGGGQDAFLARFDPTGQMLRHSTYLGGSGDDKASATALDSAGNAFLTGVTGSSDFPIAGPIQEDLGNAGGIGLDAFVSSVSADGTTLNYSTFVGGSGSDVGHGIRVGEDGAAYVAGETDSLDFPTRQAQQLAHAGSTDGFVVRLSPGGTTLDYSTLLGGSGADAASSLVVDDVGAVYTVGPTFSADSPLTIDAFQTVTAGGSEGFLAKLLPGVPPPSMTSVSAASFSRAFGLAVESLASGFGADLAAALEAATTTPLPTVLGGVSVRVTDSAGVVELAGLIVVSPGQINYVVPRGLAEGPALIEVLRDGQVVATELTRISSVAPALFSADSSGSGVAAAFWLRVSGDGSRQQDLLFDPTTRRAAPIDLGPPDEQVFLLLFGTGLRSAASVTVTINGEPVAVLGNVPQGEFEGLDQVNIGPLPRSLIGAGEVEIVLIADGVTANTVTVLLQ